MRLEVEISKTRFFVILGTLLILTGILGVIAFGGSSPSVVGHSSGEIDFTEGVQIPRTDGFASPPWAAELISFGGTKGSLSLYDESGARRVYFAPFVDPLEAEFNIFGLLKVDRLSSAGTISSAGAITEQGKKLCKEDGVDCPGVGWVKINGLIEKDVDIDQKCQSNGFRYASGRCRLFPGGVGLGEAYGVVGKWKSITTNTAIYCVVPSPSADNDLSAITGTAQEIQCVR